MRPRQVVPGSLIVDGGKVGAKLEQPTPEQRRQQAAARAEMFRRLRAMPKHPALIESLLMVCPDVRALSTPTLRGIVGYHVRLAVIARLVRTGYDPRTAVRTTRGDSDGGEREDRPPSL